MDPKTAEERFRMAFQLSPGAMSISTLAEGRMVEVNDRFAQWIGYPAEEMVGRTVLELGIWVNPEERLRMTQELQEGGRVRDRLIAVRTKGGEVRTAVLSADLLLQDGGPYILAVTQDVTEAHRMADELRTSREERFRQTFFDSLTGLPNRSLFLDRLERALARRRRRPNQRPAVLVLDLDRFRKFNDTLGRHIGDEILRGVARRLQATLRPEDTVARSGGDEFAVLVEDMQEPSHVVRIAERMLASLESWFDVAGWQMFASATIGIALAEDDDGAEQTLRHATSAVHRGKAERRGGYTLFDRAMHATAIRQLELEHDLRRALERSELTLHYQPMVSLESGTILGFEALMRWRHPERGLIQPADFIPIAEEASLIVPIGFWALEEACRETRRWQLATGRSDLTISVNLSPRQFVCAELVPAIRRALDATGLAAASLHLEITETMLIEDLSGVRRTLNELSLLGVRVALDDFGTGYSSLGYLHGLPIDCLKIDRRFVSGVDVEQRDREIARAIVSLGRALDLEVVAEGVESDEQYDALVALECDRAQGFLFSRPLPAVDVPALLSRGCILPSCGPRGPQ